MRSFLAFLFGVAAVLATLLTVPAMWVSHNVANEDGYVAFAELIARDAAFQDALANALSENLVQDSVLPASLQPAAMAAIVRVANKVSDQPGFVTAWNDTQRQSHKIMLGSPGDLPAELDSSSRFAIDLAPLGTFVINQVNKELPFTIPAPNQAVVEINGAPQAQTLDRIRESPTYARNGLIAVGVLLLVALAFARRRSVAVAWLGLGALVAAGLLKVAASVGVPEILDRNTAPTPFAKAALDVFIGRANTSFDHWLVVLAVGGAVAAVVGVAGRLLTSRSGVA
ncbi:MAG: hypothetical protein H7288_12585 [Kineosporiaceae bacterium]|nr:hypothetical protein [Aeromicrobium sp.]